MGTLPTKLPTRESLGPEPSASVSRINPSIRFPRETVGAATGAAIAGLGRTGSAIADAVYQHDQRAQEFEAERNFQDWSWQQQQGLEESARNIQPGQAKTFADDWQKGYVEAGKEYFKTVPEPLKPFIEAKMLARERDLYGSATQIGRKEQKRFSTESVVDAVNNVYVPRARTSSTADLNQVTNDFERLVRMNPDLTPVEADEIIRSGRRSIGIGHVSALEPQDVRKALEYKPNLMTGEPPGPRAMATIQTLGGIRVTVNRQAAPNFQGFLSDLEDAGAPIRSVGGYNERKIAGTDKWSQHAYGNAIDIDQSGRNVTGAEFQQWGEANKDKLAGIEKKWGMIGGQNFSNPDWGHWEWGGTHPNAIAALSDKDRMDATNAADKTLAANQTEMHERSILDAMSGNGPLPQRRAIENDPLISPQQRNALLTKFDSAAKDFVSFRSFTDRFANPAGASFNPYDKDERKNVEKAYEMLASDTVPRSEFDPPVTPESALRTVVARTGMVPDKLASTWRGDLVSGQPARVQKTLSTVRDLAGMKPTIFAGLDGHQELENAATKFQVRIERFGMTPQEATQRFIAEQAPEYKARREARIKNEDIDAIVKKQLSVDDLRSAFDTSWLPGKPVVSFEPKTRQSMYSDYVELFREHYLDTGEVSLSRDLAQNALKKIWGVTQLNGSDTVVRYPIEGAGALRGIEHVSEKIAAQAIADIKADTGMDVTRDKLRLDPIANRTSKFYWSGVAPAYQLSWQDSRGIIHTTEPGRAWVPDVRAIREADTEQYRARFDKGVSQRMTVREATSPERFDYRASGDVAERASSEGTGMRLKRAGALNEPTMRASDESATEQQGKFLDYAGKLPDTLPESTREIAGKAAEAGISGLGSAHRALSGKVRDAMDSLPWVRDEAMGPLADRLQKAQKESDRLREEREKQRRDRRKGD